MLFDSLRKFLLAGFGVQERLKEFVEELVKKGELSESQGAKLVKEWSEKAEKSTSEFEKSLSELIPKTLEKMHIPAKEDIEKLEKKIQTMSSRLKKLEGKTEEHEGEKE